MEAQDGSTSGSEANGGGSDGMQVHLGNTVDVNTRSRARWSSRRTFLLAAVGSAVGLGNVWRFPYLSFVNGGGAFLVPYILALVFLGIPLLFMELGLGQKSQLGVVGSFQSISHNLRGMGWLMVTAGFYIVTYYVMLMSWSCHFLVASFQSPVPWADDPQAYFEETILGMQPGASINDTSTLHAWSALGSLFVWVVVFFCVSKGVLSTGWVVYVTVPVPFLLLAVLFIRGVTLEGAGVGLEFYLKPDIVKVLSEPRIWTQAAAQIFFSVGLGEGIMVAFASYNDTRQNPVKDTLVIALANSVTSFFAGFCVFSVLGHMATKQGVAVADVVRSGPGLAFITFPEALSLMPAAPFFSVLFFCMIFMLGVDSAFSLVEAINTVLKDSFDAHFSEKKVAAAVCTAGFVFGLLFATDGGIFFIELIDHFVSAFFLIPIGLAEIICVAWVYGSERLLRELQELTGVAFSPHWHTLWRWVAPAIVFVVMIAEIVDEIISPLRSNHSGERFPGWALALGWLSVLLPLLIATLSFLHGTYWAPYKEMRSEVNLTELAHASAVPAIVPVVDSARE